MLELLKPFLADIIKYGGIALAGLLFWLKARQSGKNTVERKQTMETLKGVQTRDKIENDINGLSDDKLDKLCKKWNVD